jgi:Na+/H+ antiporter NhaD/arsenite permease-like protein
MPLLLAVTSPQPAPWLLAPFVCLLALIALGPLFFPDWWGKRYPMVSIGLAVCVTVFYLAVGHDLEHLADVGFDYIRFIALVGSLFVVSGGIHINVKGEATPHANVAFLFVGALVSNLIGTTGASMLLIRPWLRLNKYRVTGYHVVFFIFIVSNVGGSLTPIGDPPLYLGYLKGVPFWWVSQHGWRLWATGVGILLAAFYLIDRHNYLRAPKEVRERLAEPPDQWRVQGLRNLLCLSIILMAAFLERPAGLRELLMIFAAFLSYRITSKQVHESNHFNFHPIKEVAILFAGIFFTMTPALDWLKTNAAHFGELTPGLFYFGSGALSSVLDNAPTYLAYFSAMIGAFADRDLVSHALAMIHANSSAATIDSQANPILASTIGALRTFHAGKVTLGGLTPDDVSVCVLLGNAAYQKFLVAVSFGSVFFGANTYIGNGPNFMVKAIADHQKVHTPTFLGYIFRFTIPIMIPMLVIVWWIFLRV